MSVLVRFARAPTGTKRVPMSRRTRALHTHPLGTSHALYQDNRASSVLFARLRRNVAW